MLLKGYTTEINLEGNVVMKKSSKKVFADHSPWIQYKLKVIYDHLSYTLFFLL